MDEFVIRGEHDYLSIKFLQVFGFPNQTCNWGGYEVEAGITIKTGDFFVDSIIYSSTGQLYEFFEQLTKCNEKLVGEVRYISHEYNLQINITYDDCGHVFVGGVFDDNRLNKLSFEFQSDQTFINRTLNEFKIISGKYGGMKGVLT